MKFHQLVQEISWVQEFVTPTPTPIAMGSALKPICPPSPLVGGHKKILHIQMPSMLKQSQFLLEKQMCGAFALYHFSLDFMRARRLNKSLNE